jgi:hypothetical protein
MLDHHTLAIVLLSAVSNAVVFAVSSYIVFFRYRAPIYHLIAIYHGYFLFGFVFRPLELYMRGYSQAWSYIGYVPTDESLLWSWIIVLIGHFSILGGFLYSCSGKLFVSLLPPFSFLPTRRVLFFLVILAFVGVGVYSSLVQYGNLTSLDDTIAVSVTLDAQGGLRLQDVSGYQTIFEEWIPIALIGLFLWKRTRWLAIALVVAFIAYRLFAGAGRHKFVLLVLGLLVIKLIEMRRRVPTGKMFAGIAVILFLFNVVGDDRLVFRKVAAGDLTLSEVFNGAARLEPDSPLTVYMAEYDAFTAAAGVVPDKTGYSFGSQYLRLFVWPVPRQLWPEKPVYTLRFDLNEFGNFRFMTTTLFMDSYMNLGIGGMIAILFVLSAGLCWLYNRAASRPTPLVIMLYVVVSLFCPLLFRDGIVTAAFFVLSTSLPAVLLCKLGKVILVLDQPPSSSVAAATGAPEPGGWRSSSGSCLLEANRPSRC